VNVFLAGATGVIGRRLSLMLIADGHAVTGTTRSGAKAAQLRSSGVTSVVVDVFDREALRDAVIQTRPDIVIHQLTDLTGLLDPSRREEMLARNARLRIEGTPNLVAAAIAAGARRLIAQSIAFAYAEGAEPHAETDPLASGESGPGAVTARGVRALEEAVLHAPASKASCSATGGCTAPRRGMRELPAVPLSTSMPPRKRRALRSRTERRASTTSPKTMARSRSPRRGGSSVSIRRFGFPRPSVDQRLIDEIAHE